MIKPLISCLFACLPIGASAQTEAEAMTYGSCLMCHGGDDISGSIPPLAGKSQADLVAAMTAFAVPGQAGTIMNRFVAGLTAEEMDRLARYIASLDSVAR